MQKTQVMPPGLKSDPILLVWNSRISERKTEQGSKWSKTSGQKAFTREQRNGFHAVPFNAL